MTDRDAFLRAIRDTPADDTPRLVFADWLDDHGDPEWAELIRVQVELEPIHEELDNPRRRELADRETELLAVHADRWLGPVHDIAAEYPAYGPVFRRGLPESVSLSLDTFLARGGELFAACPTVREVCVYGVAGRGAELAACPHLAHVETLEIADWLTEADGVAIPESVFMTALGKLRLWLFSIPDWDRWLLQRFAGLYGRDWPWRVESVSVRHGPDSRYSQQFPGVTFHRPRDGPFPLLGDLGQGLWAGRGNTKVRAGPGIGRLIDGQFNVVWFNDTWQVDGRSTYPAPNGQPETVVRGLGFRPELIHARCFSTGGGNPYSYQSLQRWPRTFADYLRSPFERPPGVTDRWWADRGGVLMRWLHEGRFVIEWDGREFVLDATGTVVSS